MDPHSAACDGAAAAGWGGVFAPDALLITAFGPPASGRGEIAWLHKPWFAELESAGRAGQRAGPARGARRQ